ncbi:MAG TPA: hypothetical protein VK733_13250 [Gemmatimonadaceae bacterium]|nr:hypothetical protein [Gemmatimonadaceae bacterium]
MHLDVIPALRCPREHEESGLVLVADETRGRHVVTGVLGCPVCEAEYPIRAGVAYFVDAAAGAANTRNDEIIRAAAMLGLTEPGGVIMLGGHWASIANAISEIAEALVLVVNPPARADYAERVSVMYAERLPIAEHALRAAAIDAPIAHVASVLRAQGRLVATTAVPVPPEIAEIARDATYWVGEVSASQRPPAGLTALGIRRR